MDCEKHETDDNIRTWRVLPRCLIIAMKERRRSKSNRLSTIDSPTTETYNNTSPKNTLRDSKLFEAFIEENNNCYWNPHLDDSIKHCQYVGCLHTSTLLISARDIYLDTIRSAWARKVLRAPKGFSIYRVAELPSTSANIVMQGQFTPLPEALCLIVANLRRSNKTANLETVRAKLKDTYKAIQTPPEQVVYETLDSLLKENKLIYIGNSYEIITPETLAKLHQQQSIHNRLSLRDHSLVIDGDNDTPTLYIPILQTNQPDLRSISCQTPSHEKTKDINYKNYDRSPNRFQRTTSLKQQHRRSISVNENITQFNKSSIKRSASLRYDRKSSPIIKQEIVHSSTMPCAKPIRPKVSFIKKLFNWRNKKSKLFSETSIVELKEEHQQEIEYATFSAQFPPPDLEIENLQRYFQTQSLHKSSSVASLTSTLKRNQSVENVYEDVIVQQSNCNGTYIADDISIQYNGRILKKNNPLSKSKENGVNCVDEDVDRRASLRRKKVIEERMKINRNDKDLYYQCSNSSGYQSQQASFICNNTNVNNHHLINGGLMTTSSSISSISKQTVKENPEYLDRPVVKDRLQFKHNNVNRNDYRIVGVF